MTPLKIGGRIFSESQQRFVKPIQCPECGELIIPQVINDEAKLIVCPKCLRKIR